MGRPKGTKNKRRSPEEKESIVLELINGEESSYSISRKCGVSRGLLWTWVETYRNEGIKGFSSKVGKHKKRKSICSIAYQKESNRSRKIEA